MDRISTLAEHSKVARIVQILLLALLAVMPVEASTAQEAGGENEEPKVEQPAAGRTSAHVVVDGNQLFLLQGVSALPAEERANQVAQRIVEAASRNTEVPPVVEVRSGEFGPTIYANGIMISVATEFDSKAENVDVNTLAKLQRDAIEAAIIGYREGRTEEARARGLVGVLMWTGAYVIFIILVLLSQRWSVRRLDRAITVHLEKVEEATQELVRREAIVTAVKSAIRLFLIVIFVISVYYYVTFILLEFPETRYIAQVLISYVAIPTLAVARGIVSHIPNLVALLVIAVITRYLLRLIKLYFINLEAGSFRIKGFEKQWIWPTYNIVKGMIIVLAIVLAFPYIPGSNSAAFRGVSILLGIMVSFGSNSVVANLLAGLFVIYKRSTNIGDRIRVGEHVGDVVAVKLMETHLKSLKNELISIPNSQLLNSEVVNYTTRTDRNGLLIHTTVGIGYEEPREKIETLLIEAARRTAGIKKAPKPFVLRNLLGDYAVSYEINAYTAEGPKIVQLRSDLHGNILDVFNEAGVQIMTPSYVADPTEPKIAPPEIPKSTGKSKVAAKKETGPVAETEAAK